MFRETFHVARRRNRGHERSQEELEAIEALGRRRPNALTPFHDHDALIRKTNQQEGTGKGRPTTLLESQAMHR